MLAHDSSDKVMSSDLYCHSMAIVVNLLCITVSYILMVAVYVEKILRTGCQLPVLRALKRVPAEAFAMSIV